MKHLFFLSLILLSVRGMGQAFISNDTRCGTWVQNKPDTSDWATTDTLNKHLASKVAFHKWITGKWEYEQNLTVETIWCPCGCRETQTYHQDRIDKLTSIRQRRYITITYTYIEHKNTEYENTLDSLKAHP